MDPNGAMQGMDPNLYRAAIRGDVQLLLRLINEDPHILQTRTPQGDTALHIAARSGYGKIVKEILRPDNTLLASQNAEGDTPLHIAARTGCKEIVSLLLPADIEPQQKPLSMTNKQGNTPLHEAVRSRNNEIASILLVANPATVRIPNTKGETPLHIAAGAGLVRITREMLDYGSIGGHIGTGELFPERRSDLIKVKDASGNNALHYAALKNHAKIVGMLLEKERTLAYVKNNESLFPIHVAATHDSANAIKEILRYCPDAAEQVDSTGKNAIHIAVSNQKIEALRCLLQNIEPAYIINQGDKDGNTPLHLAAMGSRKHATKVLLRDGRVDRSIVNCGGQTPGDVSELQERHDELETPEVPYFFSNLYNSHHSKIGHHISSSMDRDLYNAAMGGDVRFLRRLIGKDPSILQTSTPQADTALHIAARSGHKEIVNVILRADNTLLASQNAERDTPLHIAARAGHKEIVSLLLPADIESQQKPLRMTNKQGNTPLHEAVKSRNDKIVSKLLDADPATGCILNDKKETPLHIAARAGLVGIAESIMKHPWVKEEELELSPTPLHLAVLGGHISMMELLLERRSDLLKVKDGSGNNALHYAALVNHAEIVGILLRKESTLHKESSLANVENNESLFPIHVAATHDSANAIKEILRYCPDAVEQVDSTGKNALHIAVINQKIEALRCLLRNIEDVKIINQGDTDGNTPLHLAVMGARNYAAKELLRDRRVDPCVLNRQRYTPREVFELPERDDELGTYEVYIWEKLEELEAKKRKKQHAEIDISRLSEKDKTIASKIRKKITSTLEKQFKLSVQIYTLVPILIATVTFAASLTMPGGLNQEYGYALLGKRVAFKIFVISDTIAMCSSVIVAFCFMWAWKNQFQFKHRQRKWSHVLTVVACLAMIATFVSAVYLVVVDKSFWLAVTVILIGCSTPFLILAILGKDILFRPL